MAVGKQGTGELGSKGKDEVGGGGGHGMLQQVTEMQQGSEQKTRGKDF